jgi:branched-subunit amino acid aminotransferase/4-amino-4-deoxychorismate lyase
MTVWRDGEFVESGGALSAANRGFLIGDGVFETLLLENGRPAFLGAHLARLRRGAAALGMDAELDEGELRRAFRDLAARVGGAGRAAGRITLSRVGGARGLLASPDACTQKLVTLAPLRAPPRDLRAVIAEGRRFSGAPTNGFKCVGAYAANMLARMEAARAGADEAIMLNEFGRVACASASNIFLIDGDTLLTPSESEGAMPGVTRALLMAIARAEGVTVRVGAIAAARLHGAALIFTNSLIGVAPGRIGETRPRSDLAMRLGAAYEDMVKSEFSEPAP